MNDALKVQTVPAAFVSLAEKHNLLVELISKMTGTAGIKVVISDSNIVIEGSGSGMPSGYSERDISVCVDGVATTYTFLTKP
jgi:hypothetical protein